MDVECSLHLLAATRVVGYCTGLGHTCRVGIPASIKPIVGHSTDRGAQHLSLQRILPRMNRTPRWMLRSGIRRGCKDRHSMFGRASQSQTSLLDDNNLIVA